MSAFWCNRDGLRALYFCQHRVIFSLTSVSCWSLGILVMFFMESVFFFLLIKSKALSSVVLDYVVFLPCRESNSFWPHDVRAPAEMGPKETGSEVLFAPRRLAYREQWARWVLLSNIFVKTFTIRQQILSCSWERNFNSQKRAAMSSSGHDFNPPPEKKEGSHKLCFTHENCFF